MIKFYILAVAIVIVLIYGRWFEPGHIIGGDWPYYYEDLVKNLPLVPPAWSNLHANGLGGKIITYSLDSYLYLVSFLFIKILSLPWILVYKLFWFGAFLIISILGCYVLGKKIFGNNLFAIFSSVLIFTTNTYILMISGGGQMGIVLAYSLAPLLFWRLLVVNEKPNISNRLYLTLILGLLMSWDIRIFSVLFIPTFLFIATNAIQELRFGRSKTSIILRKVVGNFILTYFLAFVINSYWIFPNLLNPYNPLEVLGQAFTSLESLKFFSFATLSNSISLLHPNWPENIFGKVFFQRSEYLLLPVLAFSALLYKVKGNSLYPFIALVGMVGIFLGKGANEPFGELYVFLYEKMPGFQMFRDSTKWYVLIAISYSLLIPATLVAIDRFIKKRSRRIGGWVFFGFLVFWLILIREVLTGGALGTFAKHPVPGEYLAFANKLKNDSSFYRVLWVPKQQRFSYYDYLHPSVEALPLFNATNSSQLLMTMKDSETQDLLKKYSIKYVAIPYDALGEIFLKDRMYNPEERKQVENELDSISYLNKIQSGSLSIYELDEFNPLFIGNGQSIDYEFRDTNNYSFSTNLSQALKVTFAQSFNPSWRVFINGNETLVKASPEDLIEFSVPVGKNEIEVKFTEQRNYRAGWAITVLSLLIILAIILKQKNRQTK